MLLKGRLSFYPIPCRSCDRPTGQKIIDEGEAPCLFTCTGSRDRPTARKVIDEGECVGQCACKRQELCACFPRQVRQLYRYSNVLLDK